MLLTCNTPSPCCLSAHRAHLRAWSSSLLHGPPCSSQLAVEALPLASAARSCTPEVPAHFGPSLHSKSWLYIAMQKARFGLAFSCVKGGKRANKKLSKLVIGRGFRVRKENKKEGDPKVKKKGKGRRVDLIMLLPFTLFFFVF